ncbi:hypothetical protein Acr_00g0019280 [Actinidia rufa]|uniref:Uncharacterized protein n=1 Tax=Actinidia rufa TaxID=165716 RepID=A0A7J0DBZ5_9ERIC|nr:hypothetical protein Acr_00g0019280 [Actinidia rufa]
MGPDMASRMLRMRRKARTGLGLRKEEKRPSYSLGFAELVELLGVAYNSKPVLGNLILSSILFSICHTLASPKPPKSSENTDIKQPQTFIRGDGSVLVPDFGRYMLPRKKYKGLNPFTHNPNTGTSGGTGGVGGSSSGSGGGEPHNSVSGGDDTFIPNPDPLLLPLVPPTLPAPPLVPVFGLWVNGVEPFRLLSGEHVTAKPGTSTLPFPRMNV